MRILARSLALALTVVIAQRAAGQDTGIKVGADAPAAMVETLDGRKVDLASMYGEKPVVLEFWATWCPLCRKLEPALQAAREKHGSMINFVSVGVPSNQTPERQKEYAEKQKLGGTFVFDRDGAAMKAFAVPHTSYIVVIDKHRKVVYTGVGAEQDIEAIVAKARM